MEIRNLITFTKVAEVQSLSGAARLLGYAQSTVTMQMQQLEQELGVPLYERVGKKIRITQAGQDLLTYAVPIIKMSQEALQVGRGGSKAAEGSLRLGVLEVLADERLALQMEGFLTRNPLVELEVRTEADARTLLNLLRHNEIDLMLTLDYPVTDADLVHAGEDRTEEIHFFAVKGHPLEGEKGVGPDRLFQYPLIRGTACLPYEQDLDRLIVGQEVRQVRLQNQDLALRMAARQSGRETQAGITLAPDRAAQEYIDSGKLVMLDYEMPGCQMWEQTLYHRNKWLTGAMNAWITMAEDRR